MAASSLRANLMRSILACLGVTFGVAAVVAAMAILEGSTRDVVERFEALGADQVIVMNGSTGRRGSRSIMRMSLTRSDADSLQEMDSVKSTSPESLNTAQIKHFEKNLSIQLLATNENYTQINNYKVARGRGLTRQDVTSGRKICVLGHKVAKDLFGETVTIGARVRIGGLGFTVVGVMEKKGFLGMREVDNQVMVPLSTGLTRLFGSKYVQFITVQAVESGELDSVVQEVKRKMRVEHSIRAGESDDFQVFTKKQVTDQIGDSVKILAVVLYSIAGISLVVGGIGITNIMLVSVTERTREIGIRMAVGATRRDILIQFVLEAGAISVLGGTLGVLLAYGFTDILESLIPVFQTYTTKKSIILALGMAFFTGKTAGLYPAFRASRLDPVEALRHE
ncbi:MAG: ABC transporter permease [Phycisphaerae bacterium]|nr:MAG: ABC transporter permease [Phycisphaerae bacterium]